RRRVSRPFTPTSSPRPTPALSTPAHARTGGRPRGPARDEGNEARARQALTRSKDAFLSSLPFSASRSRPFPQAAGEPVVQARKPATADIGVSNEHAAPERPPQFIESACPPPPLKTGASTRR